MDAQIERLIDDLSERGLIERTVVVVTADHGEALGQHGFMAHGWTLYDEVIRVPLIMKPAGPRGEPVRHEPVGAPTFTTWH